MSSPYFSCSSSLYSYTGSDGRVAVGMSFVEGRWYKKGNLKPYGLTEDGVIMPIVMEGGAFEAEGCLKVNGSSLY